MRIDTGVMEDLAIGSLLDKTIKRKKAKTGNNM
jgi:hypothetical protein